MGYPDPRQAIVAQLAQPIAKPLWQSRPSPGGWRSAISRGGGHDADAGTVRLVKQREILGHELHAIAFDERNGRPHRYLVGVVKGSDGDSGLSGLAGGGGGPPRRATSRGLTSAAGAGLARSAVAAGSPAAALKLRLASACASEKDQ